MHAVNIYLVLISVQYAFKYTAIDDKLNTRIHMPGSFVESAFKNIAKSHTTFQYPNASFFEPPD